MKIKVRNNLREEEASIDNQGGIKMMPKIISWYSSGERNRHGLT